MKSAIAGLHKLRHRKTGEWVISASIPKGHLVVHPSDNDNRSIDVKLLVDELRRKPASRIATFPTDFCEPVRIDEQLFTLR